MPDEWSSDRSIYITVLQVIVAIFALWTYLLNCRRIGQVHTAICFSYTEHDILSKWQYKIATNRTGYRIDNMTYLLLPLRLFGCSIKHRVPYTENFRFSPRHLVTQVNKAHSRCLNIIIGNIELTFATWCSVPAVRAYIMMLHRSTQ